MQNMASTKSNENSPPHQNAEKTKGGDDNETTTVVLIMKVIQDNSNVIDEGVDGDEDD